MDSIIIAVIVMFVYHTYNAYVCYYKYVKKKNIIFNEALYQKYDINNLVSHAKALIELNKSRERIFDSQPVDQVIVNLAALRHNEQPLTNPEIQIVEGILLANGYSFYEI